MCNETGKGRYISKIQSVDEHNYNYWLKKNTANQRESLRYKGERKSPRLTTEQQIALVIMSAIGMEG